MYLARKSFTDKGLAPETPTQLRPNSHPTPLQLAATETTGQIMRMKDWQKLGYRQVLSSPDHKILRITNNSLKAEAYNLLLDLEDYKVFKVTKRTIWLEPRDKERKPTLEQWQAKTNRDIKPFHDEEYYKYVEVDAELANLSKSLDELFHLEDYSATFIEGGKKVLLAKRATYRKAPDTK